VLYIFSPHIYIPSPLKVFFWQLESETLSKLTVTMNVQVQHENLVSSSSFLAYVTKSALHHAEMLYRLFKAIWTTEEVPSLWKEGYITKIPKKGISRNVRTIEE